MTERGDITISELNFKETIALDSFKENRYIFKDFHKIIYAYGFIEGANRFFAFGFTNRNFNFSEAHSIINGLNEDSKNLICCSEKRNIKMKFSIPSLEEAKTFIKAWMLKLSGKDFLWFRDFIGDEYLFTSDVDENGNRYCVKLISVCNLFDEKTEFICGRAFPVADRWYKFDIVSVASYKPETIKQRILVKGEIVAEEF